MQAQWQKAVLANNTEQIEHWRAELKEAEAKVEKAQQKYDAERLKEEEAKVSAAPAQAAGLIVAVGFGLQHARVRFRALQPFLLFGVMLSSQQGSPGHCVGLQPFGEWEGLLAALGSCTSSCSSCFAEASEPGVSPRLEVEGSACFALALCSPGCGCFCLRLDFQVSVKGEVKGVNPGFLVLAFSTRTVKSSGVPARRV